MNTSRLSNKEFLKQCQGPSLKCKNIQPTGEPCITHMGRENTTIINNKFKEEIDPYNGNKVSNKSTNLHLMANSGAMCFILN